METMFWIWMAAAAVFVIVEQFAPTMVFLSFAVASAVSGICVEVCGVSTSRMALTLGSFSAASMPNA